MRTQERFREVPKAVPLESDRCRCGHVRLGHGDRMWYHCISETVHVATNGDLVYSVSRAPSCDCQRFRKYNTAMEAEPPARPAIASPFMHPMGPWVGQT